MLSCERWCRFQEVCEISVGLEFINVPGKLLVVECFCNLNLEIHLFMEII